VNRGTVDFTCQETKRGNVGVALLKNCNCILEEGRPWATVGKKILPWKSHRN